MKTLRSFAIPFVLAVATAAALVFALTESAAPPRQVEAALSHSDPGSFAWEQKAAPGKDSAKVAAAEPAPLAN